QRARRGVPRVRRRLLAARRLGIVEAGEPGEREVDLAAHLEERRRRFALVGAYAEWHGRHGAQVPRHVLAARAVPARRAADERALLVDDGDRGADEHLLT